MLMVGQYSLMPGQCPGLPGSGYATVCYLADLVRAVAELKVIDKLHASLISNGFTARCGEKKEYSKKKNMHTMRLRC